MGLNTDIDQQRDIGKLWGAIRKLEATVDGNHRELMMLLVGPTRTNGINGRVRNIEEYIEEEKQKKISDAEAGQNAAKLSVELKKSRATLIGAVIVALITTVGSIAVAVIGSRQYHAIKTEVAHEKQD